MYELPIYRRIMLTTIHSAWRWPNVDAARQDWMPEGGKGKFSAANDIDSM